MDTAPQPGPDRAMRFLLWSSRYLPGLQFGYGSKDNALQAEVDDEETKPQKESRTESENIPYAWKDVRSSATPQMIVSAIVMLSAVAGGISLLRYIPFLRISIFSLIRSSWRIMIHFDIHAGHFIPKQSSSLNGPQSLFWKLVITVAVLGFGLFLLRNLPEFAMDEEQIYRQGCEAWDSRLRVRKCINFGFMHLVNIWYSIASCVVLILGGVSSCCSIYLSIAAAMTPYWPLSPQQPCTRYTTVSQSL
jgi:hypothetical protein